MNISAVPENSCTGCGCCVNACPKGCIGWKENSEGFYYPKVDSSACVDCNHCYKLCTSVNPINTTKKFNQVAYAAQHRSIAKLLSSSSGGVATAIAENFLDNNGVVYACCIDESSMNIKHIRITEKKQIGLIKGSKYVQSDFALVYQFIKRDLDSLRPIVVFGTPCQIAGLKSYLGMTDKICFVDLICHGVPSPRLFKQYVNWLLEKRKAIKLNEYQFRYKKRLGWGKVYSYEINGKVYSGASVFDPYYDAFENAKTYRESCYCCQYASLNRVGDITLGDYWHIQDNKETCFRKTFRNGVSAVIVNSRYGERVFEQIKQQLVIEKTSVEDIAHKNSSLVQPAERPSIRNTIYQSVEEKGIDFLFKCMSGNERYTLKRIKDRLRVIRYKVRSTTEE